MNTHEKHSIKFPLGSGGPFYRLQCALGLIREGSPTVGKRMLLALALTWLPLLLLWCLQPQPVTEGGDAATSGSLLTHIPTYARFFVSLPLLILSEQAVRPYLESALRHAMTSGVIPPEQERPFFDLLENALKWQESRMAELLLALLAILESQGVAAIMRANDHDSWTLAGSSLTWAGLWYFWISKPFLQFLIFRWIYRVMIWWRVMHGIARLKLTIKPAHPDGRGGLAFLGDSIQAFYTLALALAANVAGGVADYVVTANTPVSELKGFIGGGAGCILMLFAAPLLFFMKPLVRAKDEALLNYEEMAQRYCQAFDRKWHDGRQETPIAEGTAIPEFSSMTDMNMMVKGVREMKTFLFTRQGSIPLVVAIVLPFVPVLAIAVPLENILKGIVHVLMGGVE